MNLENLKSTIENIDIYLLDQILKERYLKNSCILDVGCGSGRNLKWFYNNDYTIYGIDISIDDITYTKEKYKEQSNHFSVQSVDSLNFEDNKFDHIVCNALLHFAQNEIHFTKMFSELVRVLKSKGTIFIRMATLEGMEKYATHISEGRYHLPDGTDRFLLTTDLLNKTLKQFNLNLLEPIKYINVDNKRSMATFILQKK
ncbi:MAG: class I SAM-dependent methyltransferase [Urechidicola sp.]|nr:class I SAM-dependent methyltransferase [Urechidicola sp.]